ncbi:MAG: hypothetical protein OSJ62_18275, partial [Lachnospiraceae bacterium]|nr:hypothetical protein [Lachnospiraceae bacterium]
RGCNILQSLFGSVLILTMGFREKFCKKESDRNLDLIYTELKRAKDIESNRVFAIRFATCS